MIADLNGLLVLLKRIEWQGEFGDCPECGEGGTPSTETHAEGCELKAWIDLLEAEE